MTSIEGTARPSEKDILKLVSFFQLNHDQYIIKNNVSIAYFIRQYWLFEIFRGKYFTPDTDPFIVQLRRTLQRNASYIWHAFSEQVRICRISDIWWRMDTSKKVLTTSLSNKYPVTTDMVSKLRLKEHLLGFQDVAKQNSNESAYNWQD